MGDYMDVHGSSDYVEKYKTIIADSDMSSRQKKQIDKFITDLKIGKAGQKVAQRRIAMYLQFLLKLHKYLKQDIDQITEKKAETFYKKLLEDKILKNNGKPFSQSSKDEFIKALKRFLGWAWGNNTTKYRKTISWMKEENKGSERQAITFEEAEKVVKNWDVVRDQALFMFLFDSGARIEEALNVRLQDLTAKEGKRKYYLVHLRGQKTQESDRTISIPLTTKYLNKWLKQHPTNEENDFLFPVRYNNARKIIKQMSLKTLNKGVKPHELRHSSATYYIQYGGFGAQNIGGFYYRYGWKFGSKEALTYIKTYLYGGEIGQEQVVKNIENNRVEQLEKEVEKLRKDNDELKKGLNFVQENIGVLKEAAAKGKLIKSDK